MKKQKRSGQVTKRGVASSLRAPSIVLAVVGVCLLAVVAYTFVTKNFQGTDEIELQNIPLMNLEGTAWAVKEVSMSSMGEEGVPHDEDASKGAKSGTIFVQKNRLCYLNQNNNRESYIDFALRPQEDEDSDSPQNILTSRLYQPVRQDESNDNSMDSVEQVLDYLRSYQTMIFPVVPGQPDASVLVLTSSGSEQGGQFSNSVTLKRASDRDRQGDAHCRAELYTLGAT